jgi:hypothetical protein
MAFAAFRRLDAEWELARWQPEFVDKDLPDEAEARFCSEHSATLNAYFLTPAEDYEAVRLKLKTYVDEVLYDAGDCGGKIIRAIHADMLRLCRGGVA